MVEINKYQTQAGDRYDHVIKYYTDQIDNLRYQLLKDPGQGITNGFADAVKNACFEKKKKKKKSSDTYFGGHSKMLTLAQEVADNLIQIILNTPRPPVFI